MQTGTRLRAALPLARLHLPRTLETRPAHAARNRDDETIAVLRRSEERYALAAAGADDGLWDWDLRQGHVYFCPRWKAMLGLRHSAGDDSASLWFGRVQPDELPSLRRAVDAHLAGATAHLRHEHRLRHEHGGYRSVLCRARAVRNTAGVAIRLAGTFTDITEWATKQEGLRHAAEHDVLTALPNRAFFLQALTQAMEAARLGPGRRCAILFVDLDGFKAVNDTHGHLAGDQVLVAVARRLESGLRAGDTLARFAGDEFTILLDGVDDPRTTEETARRIAAALGAPLQVAGRRLHVTASIGIAWAGPSHGRPEDLIRDADAAMYRAKALGRARHEVFDRADF